MYLPDSGNCFPSFILFPFSLSLTQAAWRGLKVRRQIASMHMAAIKIEAAWRGAAARRLLRDQHAAATIIQAARKGYAVRSWLQLCNTSATCIQVIIIESRCVPSLVFVSRLFYSFCISHIPLPGNVAWSCGSQGNARATQGCCLHPEAHARKEDKG